jgi:hypothetical protein
MATAGRACNLAGATSLLLLECSAPDGDHWITSSARASTDAGIVRPSAFAGLEVD